METPHTRHVAFKIQRPRMSFSFVYLNVLSPCVRELGSDVRSSMDYVKCIHILFRLGTIKCLTCCTYLVIYWRPYIDLFGFMFLLCVFEFTRDKSKDENVNKYIIKGTVRLATVNSYRIVVFVHQNNSYRNDDFVLSF